MIKIGNQSRFQQVKGASTLGYYQHFCTNIFHKAVNLDMAKNGKPYYLRLSGKKWANS